MIYCLKSVNTRSHKKSQEHYKLHKIITHSDIFLNTTAYFNMKLNNNRGSLNCSVSAMTSSRVILDMFYYA